MAITDLSQLDLDGTYSYADYLTWKFDERVELIKGKISLMCPAPNVQHQQLSVYLTGTLFIFRINPVTYLQLLLMCVYMTVENLFCKIKRFLRLCNPIFV